jgi:hypothetical protein
MDATEDRRPMASHGKPVRVEVAVIISIIITIWLALSPFIGWLWGRFVRVGMVELQKEDKETPP